MKTQEIIKIKENLFLQGNKVFSYQTHVATIEGKKLIELGIFSKTTSKHISTVAYLYGLEVVATKKENKPSFDKLPYGVKINKEYLKVVNNL